MQGTGKNCISTLFLLEGKLPQTMGEESDNPGSVCSYCRNVISERYKPAYGPDEVLTECEKAGVFLF